MTITDRNTSRTWELELLISGAVVFALLNVPRALDRVFLRAQPGIAESFHMPAFMLYFYAKAIVIVLIAAFIVHLAARAYWVGLIGLDSVFPNGPIWDKLSIGPFAREVYAARIKPLPHTIERLDNFASGIFSFAFIIVMMFALSILVGAAFLGIGLLASALSGGRLDFLKVSYTLFIGAAVFAVLPPLLDRAFGPRLMHTRADGIMRRLVGWAYHMQGIALVGPPTYTLFSNLRGRLMYTMFNVAVLLIFALVLMSTFTSMGIVSLTGEAYLPANAGARGVAYEHYEDRGAHLTGQPVPTIQSDIVTEPYVRLFLPYTSRRDNEAIARLCPDAPQLTDEGVMLRRDRKPPAADSLMAPVVRCIAGYSDVRLDGQPLAADWRFFVDPKTGREGLVAYLPATGLAPGAHRLTVERTPHFEDGERLPDWPPWEIPFWR